MAEAVDLAELRKRIAAADVYDLACRTPLEEAASLGTDTQRIWLKREDQQDVFSFKIRGAANRMAGLSAADRARGVVAASAGNHAQGVASAARHHGCASTIFMPVTTPPIKVDAVRAMGSTVRLEGESYDAACEAAVAFADEAGAVFIHPFDELPVIAGQGTVGRELLEEMPSPAAIYVCCGGGGLVSGIGAWAKWLSPDTRIIAVEAEGAPTLHTALAAGGVTTLPHIDTFADGAAVRTIGELTYAICREVVDEVVLVTNDEISAAVRDIFEATRTVVEPAGALALAGAAKQMRDGTAPSGDLVCTVSGANVNFDRIGHIVERAELGAGEEMLLAVTLPEERGSFLRFVEVLGDRAVTEFNYRFEAGPHPDKTEAHILVGIKTSDFAERATLVEALGAAGFPALDLSRDSLAKRHLRHLVGGRSAAGVEERIFRVEFPERPGALSHFLTRLDSRWNISLFHYRNHGAVQGHVLCGFHLPRGDAGALRASLDALGYPVVEETDAAAARFFL